MPRKTRRASSADKPASPSTLKFDFIKSSQFRVVHGDGVFGGSTTGDSLAITVFSERVPIPKQVVHVITPEGTLGEEIQDGRIARDAIVREAEVCIMMSLPAARSMRDWLNRHIKTLETRLSR